MVIRAADQVITEATATVDDGRAHRGRQPICCRPRPREFPDRTISFAPGFRLQAQRGAWRPGGKIASGNRSVPHPSSLGPSCPSRSTAEAARAGAASRMPACRWGATARVPMGSPAMPAIPPELMPAMPADPPAPSGARRSGSPAPRLPGSPALPLSRCPSLGHPALRLCGMAPAALHVRGSSGRRP